MQTKPLEKALASTSLRGGFFSRFPKSGSPSQIKTGILVIIISVTNRDLIKDCIILPPSMYRPLQFSF